MDCYIFDTEVEAIAAQASDYSEFINNLPTTVDDGQGGEVLIDNSAYINTTTSWSLPIRVRATDSKYIYPLCPSSTATGRVVEELNTGGEWFPADPE